MKFGTWNDRTLMEYPNSDRLERRTAIIAWELHRFNFNIVALSKTRTAGEGQLKEEQGQYTFFWKGLDPDQSRIHGVGLAIRNTLPPKLTELPFGINACLMTLRIKIVKNQQATIISVYADDDDDQHSTLMTGSRRVSTPNSTTSNPQPQRTTRSLYWATSTQEWEEIRNYGEEPSGRKESAKPTPMEPSCLRNAPSMI